MIKKCMVLCLSLLLWLGAVAQQTEQSGKSKVLALVKKYEQTKGVDAMVCEKGSGLELVKMMLRKEMGKDFVKGINIIVIIDYSKATEQIAGEIRASIDTFSTIFQPMPLEKADVGSDCKKAYFKVSPDEKYITDMVMILEDKEEKCAMYFGGQMKDDDEPQKK